MKHIDCRLPLNVSNQLRVTENRMKPMSSNRTRFETALSQGQPILIDGGLATELEAQGHDISTELWSAALLLTNPRAIVDAHRAYLEAGASCLITASYQASRQGFLSLNLSCHEANELIARSVTLALLARDEFLQHTSTPPAQMPFIAASIGPYGAIMHDGSEYTGHYAISMDALKAFHADRLHLLDNQGADFLACETIPSLREAEVLHDLLMQVNSPAWVSFSCRDPRHISDGTPIAQVAALFRDHPRVLAVGANCTAPQFITSLIQEIKQAVPNKAIVAYPNSGESYDATRNAWFGTTTPVECASAAQTWFKAGAQLIGGCCRMGPSHIRAMQQGLSHL